MLARFDFVEQHYRSTLPLIDVGIGSRCVHRVATRSRPRHAIGYDVNPVGIAWLDERSLLVDPHLVSADAITLWDALEHIPDFQSLLGKRARMAVHVVAGL